jgi:hypothetical protein
MMFSSNNWKWSVGDALKLGKSWLAVFLGLVLALGTGGPVFASSHREAPLIAGMPRVDGTDFYMFRSYETGRSGFVTIIANYNPLQDGYGGPNYFTMDPHALYEIHIDNVGDGHEHLTFQFRFTNVLNKITVPVNGVNVPIPLRTIGAVAAGNSANINEVEQYTVKMVTGNRRTGTVQPITNAADGTSVFVKPLDYIGNKTFTNAAGYNAYAQQYMYSINIPGSATPGRMFVGQRQDPFPVDLGEVFDLVNLNPVNPTGKVSSTLRKNVTSICLEIPISALVSGSNPIIGGWTTASVRQGRLINIVGGYETVSVEGGAWAQVSRLGMPLVNEVVIGLPDKDKFNSSEPKDDAQFLTYVTNPTLPVILNVLFSTTPPPAPRNDLVAVFLTGVPNVNEPTGVVPSEMLRLNTAIPATTISGSNSLAPSNGLTAQNPLGAAQCFPQTTTVTLSAAGCDPAGFPNGRRPGDDVVNIALDVVNGFLLNNSSGTYTGNYPLSDGVETGYLAADFVGGYPNAVGFPYLNPPVAGSPQNATGAPY